LVSHNSLWRLELRTYQHKTPLCVFVKCCSHMPQDCHMPQGLIHNIKIHLILPFCCFSSSSSSSSSSSHLHRSKFSPKRLELPRSHASSSQSMHARKTGGQGGVSTGHFPSLAGRGRGISRMVPVGFVQLHMRQLHVLPGVDRTRNVASAYARGANEQPRKIDVQAQGGGRAQIHRENHQ